MPSLVDLPQLARQALEPVASALHAEFGSELPAETIDSFLVSSYEQLAPRATTDNLPLVVEQFARQRLRAAAGIEHRSQSDAPIVLFLCVHNAGRSQMALGWFNHLAGHRAVAWSGGSEPAAEVNPVAVAVMAEVGIDIGREFPKPWTAEVVRAADVVVTMGCGDACPYYPGIRYEDWDLEDPAGQGVDAVRSIRDDIESRVRTLLTSLAVSVP